MPFLSLLWVFTGLASAVLFYASMPHQRLLPQWPQRGAMRAAGCVVFLISVLLAVYVLGLWSGLFASLTALMLGCVVLPYINAWQIQRKPAHVE